MSDAPVAVTIDAAQVTALLQKLPGAVTTRLGQLIEKGAISVQRQMRIAANVGVTGQLRNSINYTLSADKLSAEVTPGVDYAADVEGGTQPHLVSVADCTPLREWADFKGINPYALQKSIAARGTQPHPFIQPTYELMDPQVRGDLSDGIAQLVQEINDGRI